VPNEITTKNTGRKQEWKTIVQHFNKSGQLQTTTRQHRSDLESYNIHCVSKTFPPLNSLYLCQILADFQNICTA